MFSDALRFRQSDKRNEFTALELRMSLGEETVRQVPARGATAERSVFHDQSARSGDGRKTHGSWAASSVAAGSLVAAVLLTGCSPDFGSRTSTSATAEPTPVTQSATPEPMVSGRGGPASAVPNPSIQVYERNGASVVNIASVAIVPTFVGPTERQGVGSGFVLDGDGRIVTNNHVVQQADQLNVTFQDRTSVPGRLVGRDPDNDLAVIQVDTSGNDDGGRPIRDLIKPVMLGDSDRITIGEDAIAIGSPLGLRQTVTAGIVSALRNPGEEAQGGQLELLGGAVQTDASINPGNSGGPLFNAAGEVIGVNTAILSQSGGNIGIGFAIPVNVVKRVVPELIQSGCYRHPFIGVSTLPLAQIGQAAKRQLGIGPNQKGLLVQESSAGAQEAGIQAGSQVLNLGGEPVRAGGDIIVAIDGREVTTGGDLRAYIENNKRPGDTVTLTILRNGQRQEIQVRLGERPTQQTCR
jgi:2-alkenal reductase